MFILWYHHSPKRTCILVGKSVQSNHSDYKLISVGPQRVHAQVCASVAYGTHGERSWFCYDSNCMQHMGLCEPSNVPKFKSNIFFSQEIVV